MRRKGPQQMPISAKLDTMVYAWLKAEAAQSGIPGNRIINKAILLYVEVMRTRRNLKYETLEEQQKELKAMAAYLLGIEPMVLFPPD